MPDSSSHTVADAIAAALSHLSVKVVTHVPGFGASQTFAALQKATDRDWPLSLHEEVAFAVAHGAALMGGRSATLIKTHGLAKAANAVLAALSCGTNAGCVSLVFDDVKGSHSDNILDSPRLLDGLGLPWERLEPKTAFARVVGAFERSERLGLPVALLVDADSCDLPSVLPQRPPASTPPPAYRRDPLRHVVCPLFSPYQHQVLTHRRAGRTDQAAAVPRPPLPRLPDDLPTTWQPTLRAYQPLFEAFRNCPRAFVAGDTGLSSLFALPPYDCVDAVCYLGGSVPLAIGAGLALPQSASGSVWALSGDFAFIAAGHLGLWEAELRHAPLKLLLVHNGRSQATGGQPMPDGLLERILMPFTGRTTWVRSQKTDAVRGALEKADAAAGLHIVVADLREVSTA